MNSATIAKYLLGTASNAEATEIENALDSDEFLQRVDRVEEDLILKSLDNRLSRHERKLFEARLECLPAFRAHVSTIQSRQPVRIGWIRWRPLLYAAVPSMAALILLVLGVPSGRHSNEVGAPILHRTQTGPNRELTSAIILHPRRSRGNGKLDSSLLRNLSQPLVVHLVLDSDTRYVEYRANFIDRSGATYRTDWIVPEGEDHGGPRVAIFELPPGRIDLTSESVVDLEGRGSNGQIESADGYVLPVIAAGRSK